METLLVVSETVSLLMKCFIEMDILMKTAFHGHNFKFYHKIRVVILLTMTTDNTTRCQRPSDGNSSLGPGELKMTMGSVFFMNILMK